ncbi:flagellar export chaperone FliS [Clostridiales bacterium COT073_COT-073]|nr:flagellar export chaperone FliS [Clostridiales bacterium COT073_COT-073]
MQNNPYAKIKNNSIMTATPAELTLMLYEGAIKFGNQAVSAIQDKEIPEAHRLIIRVQDIIDELRGTLNFDYPIAAEMDRLYEFISYTLIEANMEKDAEKLETALSLIRDFRDTWKEAMTLAKK